MSLQESQEAAAHFTKEYADFKKTYPGLPTLEQLDGQLDILEYAGREKVFPRNALRLVRWQLMNGINSWMGYLHNFILPNPQSAASMEEYDHFTDAEKQEMIKILNWSMYRNREMNLLQLNEEDDKTAVFVTTVFKEWLGHKKVIERVLEKNMASWKGRL